MVIIEGQMIIIGTTALCDHLWRLDLSDVPGVGNQQIIESGSRPDMDSAAAHYHAATRKIYVYKPQFGSTIYTLSVPADMVNGTYTWSSITAGGVKPTLGASTNSNFTHFNIIQDMGDGQGALITNNAKDASTFMYKLPRG